MEKYILALDQGTTSSRAIVFNKKGKAVASAQKEFTQIFPRPGWVEHNAEEIWESQIFVAGEALKKAGIEAKNIDAIGITNQRETTLLWDRKTGNPVSNAIVWQCRRTTDICNQLKDRGLSKLIKEKTGLVLDPYFSGTKIKWLLDNIPGLKKKAENGSICFGTIDSWLIYRLSGNHLTDPSNASRTLLFNIHTGRWDKEILKLLQIPPALLPEVLPSSGYFGKTKKELFGQEIQIGGVAGDQQAALFGQACFKNGDVKNTYGTGCFTLLNTGKVPVASNNGLLTTVAWDIGRGLEYALEGSVFIAGAVIQWLRDGLAIINSAPESEELARSVLDSKGVFIVPAFVGLGAPYWEPDIRGTIVGLNRGTSRAHITRAALESIAYQTCDLITAMEQDYGQPVICLKADGGASQNSFLMQFQADILNRPVILPETFETTALGAAYLAGLYTGYWNDLEEIQKNWQKGAEYKPEFTENRRKQLLSAWKQAVQTARQYKPSLLYAEKDVL
jgi:glycerol kinase